ncbi:MAG: ParA family protein [Candidatus Nomurabacteria bacterium]|jgi:chromosome partitioning protein|nr:ParA family protein [Candidatus Nomurabacteria bacterium]
MSAITIAITNQKGGVGKTTTAVNLSFYLAKTGYRVLLIDFDPQGNATSGLGIDKSGLSASMLNVMDGTNNLKSITTDLPFKNLTLAPATPDLANAEPGLATAADRFNRLKNAIAAVSDSYDTIIIDVPPSLGLLTVNALTAANYVLLPVQAEFYAMEGLSMLLETMQLVRKKLNPTLSLIGVLVTMFNNTTLSKQVYEEVAKHFPGKVFETKIPRNVRLAEAPSNGLPVGAYDGLSKGARAYKAATKELIGRINGD